MGERWMVLGSSPSAPEHYQKPVVDVVATAGDGISLLPTYPDYHFIGEPRGLWRLEELIEKAHHHGTKIVFGKGMERDIRKKLGLSMSRKRVPATKDERRSGRHNRHNYPHDHVIRTRHKRSHWVPGEYTQICSGGLAFQWAVMAPDVSEIHMVGLEGYTGGHDYYTGQAGTPEGKLLNTEVYGPLMQSIVSQCPQIQFIVYGELRYPLDGENVTHA